jgi:hypothetical protein
MLDPYQASTENISGNGSGEPDTTKKLESWLNRGTFDGIFTSQQVASAIEKFVDPGDTIKELLLRGDFRAVTHLNSALRLNRKAEHFHDKELETLLHNHMAGYPALGGQRIRILLSAVVGQLNNDKEHNLGNRVKGLLGGNKDGDK